MSISSKIEIIGDLKYIVERDENGTIICQSLFDESVIVPSPPNIKLSTVGSITNGASYMEFIVNETGTYRLDFGRAAKKVTA